MQVVFVFALISTLVLSIVLLGIVWVVSSVAVKRAASENFAREAFFFRSQLGQYACSLLLSKWISCLGGLIAIKWVNEGGISTGVKIACRDAFALIVTFRRTILLYSRCESRTYSGPKRTLTYTLTQVSCTRSGSLDRHSSLS